MERIINIGNHSIDFERIRAIKHNSYRDLGPTNIIIIEYNARIEYSKNPFTQEIEKTEIIDKIEIEFNDFEIAKLNHISITQDWNNYLENLIN